MYIWGFSMACCWKPFMSEKERLKLGAAMMPCGELLYMGAGGCCEEPAGKDEEASDERATCIATRRAGGRAGDSGGGAESR